MDPRAGPARIRSLTYTRTRNGRPNPSHEWRYRAAWQGLGIKIYTTQSPASNQLLADPWRPPESMGHSQSRFKSSMIAAPVKKHRFIKYYHLTREEGLTPKTIKSGWRASGIYPWNPQKGL